jgi:hypothetical protein
MFRASRTWIPSALEKRFEISVSLHQDMEANVKFISCNVPTTCNPLGACAALVGMVDEFLSISEKTVVASGFSESIKCGTRLSDSVAAFSSTLRKRWQNQISKHLRKKLISGVCSLARAMGAG